MNYFVRRRFLTSRQKLVVEPVTIASQDLVYKAVPNRTKGCHFYPIASANKYQTG